MMFFPLSYDYSAQKVIKLSQGRRNCNPDEVYSQDHFVNKYTGRIQDMDPRPMDHTRGLGPWAPSWTRSMDYPCGPPLIL